MMRVSKLPIAVENKVEKDQGKYITHNIHVACVSFQCLSMPHINGSSMHAVFVWYCTSVTRAPLHRLNTKAACNVMC